MIALLSLSLGRVWAIESHDPISDQPIEQGNTAVFLLFSNKA